MPFVVGVVVECEKVPAKDKLKRLVVDVGTERLTIVSNAPNIREGTRTVVATIGTELELDGESQVVKRVAIAGVQSEGMVCDSCILGWAGGAAGIAVQVPDSYELGSTAPTSKPRMDGISSVAAVAEPELSAKELKAKEKAQRKTQLAEKKAARKAKKGGTDDATEEMADDDGAKISGQDSEN